MNTRPLEMITHEDVERIETETDVLVRDGFSQDEIISLLWLRQWYQNGGSDRVAIVRRLEFLKQLIANGRVEL